MSQGAPLPLRDIHLPVAPHWWPPAPGWWLLGGLVLVGLVVVAALAWRRMRRRLALLRMFDQRVDTAADPAARVAAISELLRRAARERDPAAAALQGGDWLAFLDRDAPLPGFDGAAGRLLLDAGYRRDVDPAEVEALRATARQRFVQLVGGQR